MSLTRIHTALSPTMLRNLDKLATRYGMDRSETIRHCIVKACEEAGIYSEAPKKMSQKNQQGH